MIDLHCHLDLYPDPFAVAERCKASGDYVLSVTTTPKAWRGTLKLAAGAPRVRTALGLHPQLAYQRHGELPLFTELLMETKYVGEVGLDGSANHRAHLDVQTRCFDAVLAACVRTGGRVMTVHSRGAADEVLDALNRHPGAGTAVLHWFSGTRRQLERAKEMGCWFSVGPAMIRGRKGCQLLADMPPERVLTETDGPFSASASGLLMPGEVTKAVEACGTAWGVSPAEAQVRLDSNLRLLSALD